MSIASLKLLKVHPFPVHIAKDIINIGKQGINSKVRNAATYAIIR